MTTRIDGRGPSFGPANRDKEGNRTFKVWFYVECEVGDGPAAVLQTPGLPIPGSFWLFYEDSDDFAFCYWACDLDPVVTDEPNTLWKVTYTFSTKPEDKFCRTQEVEDPLLEPPKISGSFARYTEEATRDRWGVPITNSSWEQIRGPLNEWDKNRLSIKIQQNVGTSLQGYILPTKMLDCVNSLPLWGLPPRTIKLSSSPWEAKFWGSCSVYYTRTLEFDIRYNFTDDGHLETWDRDLMDEGTKVLNGHWNPTTGAWVLDNIDGKAPDPANPAHFIKATDLQGNISKIPLNGGGLPANVVMALLDLFVSITNANTGNNPADTDNWIPIRGAIPVPIPAWVGTNFYHRGDLVIDTGLTWICLVDRNPNDDALGPQAPQWKQIAPLVNKGVWDNAATYAVGDYVSGGNITTGVGTIHIERYTGVDFTLLGIPLSF